MSTSTPIPERACWFCGVGQDRADRIEADGKKPRPKDVTVCLECGAPGVFIEGLAIRPMTTVEMVDFFLDDDCARTIGRITAFNLHRGKSEEELWSLGKKPLI